MAIGLGFLKKKDNVSKEEIENEVSSVIGDFVKVEWC